MLKLCLGRRLTRPQSLINREIFWVKPQIFEFSNPFPNHFFWPQKKIFLITSIVFNFRLNELETTFLYENVTIGRYVVENVENLDQMTLTLTWGAPWLLMVKLDVSFIAMLCNMSSIYLTILTNNNIRKARSVISTTAN